MSEENLQEPNGETPTQKDATKAEEHGRQSAEFILNRITNELTLVDSAGKAITFKARIIEEEQEEEQGKTPAPLTPDEFRVALQRIDALGLTWTADLYPHIKSKSSESEDALASEEFRKLQKQYPQLPRELYVAVSYLLTGNKAFTELVGTEEHLREKAAIARELLVNTEYRSEFFFKHAIKVPYLRDIDYEVVFKLSEKNVKAVPGISYGLLALTLHDPFITGRPGNIKHITVAVDEKLVNRLLETLNEVKEKLVKAREITEVLNKQPLFEEESNESDSPKQLE